VSGLVLGLDTSGMVAAGLARDGVVLASVRHDDSRAHVERLTPMVQTMLADAGAGWGDVSRVVVGVGPGPFTGLRVGIASAEVLALALGVPCTGVCSLDVLARQAVLAGAVDGGFVVVTDARRREVYSAGYDADGRRTSGPRVGPVDEVPALPVVGPGAHLDPELADRSVPTVTDLDAGVLAAAVGLLPDAGLEPLYLRRPDATVPGRPKSTLVSPPPRLRTRPRAGGAS
jgi:tRNA threonylcarbamoyl adenosine modification protein YeaZ